jgi:hypothetical protein
MRLAPTLLLLLLLSLRAGDAAAQAGHRAEMAISVLEHLHQALGSSPAVLDLRLLCAAEGPEACSEALRDAATGLALLPRVPGAWSFCMNGPPPCASGEEVMVTVHPPSMAGDSATVQLMERRPRARWRVHQAASDLVLVRADDGWTVRQRRFRWRS